jgi:hypothetical protein
MERSKSFIYVLQHAHEQRIKIGRSIRPGTRARELPDTVDYSRSFQASVDHRRARDIEATLHSLVSEFAVVVDHGGDGATEWFDAKARPIVLAFIERNPDIFSGAGIADLESGHSMLCIRVSSDERRRIKVLAAELGMTIQDMMVLAINKLLVEYGVQPIGSERSDSATANEKTRP